MSQTTEGVRELVLPVNLDEVAKLKYLELTNGLETAKYVEDLFYLVLLALILYVSKTIKKFINSYSSNRKRLLSLTEENEDPEAMQETEREIARLRGLIRLFVHHHQQSGEDPEAGKVLQDRGRDSYSDVTDNEASSC